MDWSPFAVCDMQRSECCGHRIRGAPRPTGINAVCGRSGPQLSLQLLSGGCDLCQSTFWGREDIPVSSHQSPRANSVAKFSVWNSNQKKWVTATLAVAHKSPLTGPNESMCLKPTDEASRMMYPSKTMTVLTSAQNPLGGDV